MQWKQRFLVLGLVSSLGCATSDSASRAGDGAGAGGAGAGGRDVSDGAGGSGGAGGRDDFGSSGIGGFVVSDWDYKPIPLDGVPPCEERPVFCESTGISADAAADRVVEIGGDCRAPNFPCGGTIGVLFDDMGCAIGLEAPDLDEKATSCVNKALTAERWACAAGLVVHAGGWNCE
ncbi:hypothetical protein [Sorangium sp. So ce385]|uniref:hypothetical protein n=1 Tax=Sorangium sp. So ce385 TaxID=3133308 RepID=UPI003F5B8CEC